MSGRSVRRGSMLVSAAVAGVVALSGCSTDETAAPTSAPQVDEETTTITTTTTVEDDSESADTPNPDVDDNDTDGGSSAPIQEESFEEAVADLNSMEGGNGSGWTVTDNTNWDTTSELTFASAVQNEITTQLPLVQCCCFIRASTWVPPVVRGQSTRSKAMAKL